MRATMTTHRTTKHVVATTICMLIGRRPRAFQSAKRDISANARKGCLSVSEIHAATSMATPTPWFRTASSSLRARAESVPARHRVLARDACGRALASRDHGGECVVLCLRHGEAPAAFHVEPIGRVRAPVCRQWWLPFVGTVIAFGLVDVVGHGDEVFRVDEVVGLCCVD